MEVRYKECPGYLLVKVYGQWEELDAKEEIEALREEANKRGITRLLLDVRSMTAPESQAIRFATGEHIAKIWPPPFKVVALADPELKDGFTENVAVTRGAVFTVVTDEAAAIHWLMKGASSE
jgi:hypothetical protein